MLRKLVMNKPAAGAGLKRPVVATKPSGQTLAKPNGTATKVLPKVLPKPNGSAGNAIAKSRAFTLAAENDAEQKQRKAAASQPFRIKLDVGEEGRRVVVTDRREDPFFRYEHYIPNASGKGGVTEACIARDGGACPVCEKMDKQGGYVILFSCIDTKAYTPQKGPNAGKTVARSKKVLPVKGLMQNKFARIYKEMDGNMRGVVLELTRDAERSEAIGDEVKVIKRLSEAELAKMGDLAEPFDFEKLFPTPTEAELRKRYRMSAPAGSQDLAGAEDDADGLGDVDI